MYFTYIQSVESNDICTSCECTTHNLMWWRVEDGSLVWGKVLNAEIEAVTFSPDGKFIAAYGRGETMYVFNTETFEQVTTYPMCRIEYLDFSKNGRLMAIGQENSGLLSLYLIHSQKYDGNHSKLAKKY